MPEDFKGAEPIPMQVIIKEDIQRLPVATPMHPASLARRVPDEALEALQDKVFNTRPGTQDVTKALVDAVPDADVNQTVMRDYRKAAGAGPGS